MRVSNAKWVQVSRATLTKKYIPQCAGLIRTYVLNQLRGKSPCIVIDEMSKMGRSYYNVHLTYFEKLQTHGMLSAMTPNDRFCHIPIAIAIARKA